jgi:hypothetical protein
MISKGREHVDQLVPETLVDPAALAQAVNRAGGKRGVAASVGWLTLNAGETDAFSSVEDWAVETGGEGPFAHHLLQVRAELARQLWQRRLFVGVSVLDELLFKAIHGRSDDPVLDVLNWLASSPLTKPAYVIYPLHSVGLIGAGLLVRPNELTCEQLAREYGVAICAQHNRMRDVTAWLAQVHDWFGVEGQVPVPLLEHWRRSRDSWVKSNPLLAVKVHVMSGSYYENQRLLLDRLHIATAFFAGLAVRQPSIPPDDRRRLYSTRRINNWQTLDIHHYFVMDANLDSDGALTGDAVPISRDAGYLAELSDLPIDLDLAYWNQQADEARGLWQALNSIDSFQQPARFSRTPSHARVRLACKLFESLDYFRRSLGSDRWYAVTSLGTAFEMLLTSHYAPGVTDRLERRVKLLTADADAAQAVRDVYEARSGIVHAGKAPPEGLAIHVAQRAYLQCLEAIAVQLDSVAEREADPLRRISGDASPDREDGPPARCLLLRALGGLAGVRRWR